MRSKQIIEQAKNKAHRYEKEYGGCSQSVLEAVQEELGIGGRDSFRAANMLAGGIARQGETCGAIVGALCALGLVVGRERIEDTVSYKQGMEHATRITARFKEELTKQFGFSTELKSTLCRDIHKLIYGRAFNLSDKAELQAFLDAGGHGDTGCPKVCGIAASIVAEEILKIESGR